MKINKLLIAGILTFVGLLSFSSADCTFHGEAGGYNNVSFPSGITSFNYTGNCVRFNSFNNSLYIFSSLFHTPNLIETYTFACGNFSVNNEGDSTQGSLMYYDNIPYYQDGYITISNYTGSIELTKKSSGYIAISDNKCMYFPSQTSYTNNKICTDSTQSNCITPGYSRIVCGDSMYYYNTTTYTRSYYFYILDFGLSTSNSGNQSDFTPPVQGGVRDYNSMLIEKAILCYMSDGVFGGEYGDCDGINYSGFINQYNPSYTTWSGSSIEDYYGQLLFTNAQPVLSNYCVNTDLIQYPFCSQLDLYSGAYLLYFFENGKLDYYVLGDGFGVDLGNLGSGQLGELTCTGVWCNGNINEGLPEYINTFTGGQDNNVFSGEILDSSYFIDLFTDNLFFSCPFNYSGSSFTIGNKLINALGGRDILKPINCFIAGFRQGQSSTFFGNVDNYFGTGTLLSGTSQDHNKLYLFFDILLSIGLIIIYSKLFNSFMHK